MKKCGYFDDTSKEYVILKPKTPTAWLNYLGIDGVLSGIISQTSGGTVWFEDPLENRLLRYHQIGSSENTPGRYLYIRDNEQGRTFAPMSDPVFQDRPEIFECRHGLGYTRFLSLKNGLHSEIHVFIPKTSKLPVEVQFITLTNRSTKPRNLSIFSYREFITGNVLDEIVRPAIRNYTVNVLPDRKNGVIYLLTGRSLNNRNKPIIWFGATLPVRNFDTDRDAFIGNGALSAPDAIVNGQCTNSISRVKDVIGVHQVDLKILPGETKRFAFLLGIMQQPVASLAKINPDLNSRRQVQFVMAQWRRRPAQMLRKSLAAIKQHYTDQLAVFQCKLPRHEKKMERQVNIWNGYGVWQNFLHARALSDHASGISRPFLGTRDAAQDLYAIAQINPAAARQRILAWFRFAQMHNGACFHHFNPKTGANDGVCGYSDDHLWIIRSVSIYIKESGDLRFLFRKIGYADRSASRDPVLIHLLKALRYTMSKLGPNGLPLMLTADWNNVFASSYEKNSAEARHREKAESVMVGMMTVDAGKLLIEMLAACRSAKPASMDGLADIATYLNTVVSTLSRTINEKAWFDGENGLGWYAMGTDANAKFFGTPHDCEGRIFLLPQVWAILSGLADKRKQGKLKRAVKKELYRKNCGLLLLAPSYTTTPPLGSFNIYSPGSRENGANFCHAHAMATTAFASVHDARFTHDLYRVLLPEYASETLTHAVYCGPPYAYSQFRYGPDHPLYGQARGSWLTGTAAWSYYGVCQNILGIRPDFDGLIIDPVMPSGWNGFYVERKFRNILYKITVTRKAHIPGCKVQIRVNGRRLTGNKIRLANGRTFLN